MKRNFLLTLLLTLLPLAGWAQDGVKLDITIGGWDVYLSPRNVVVIDAATGVAEKPSVGLYDGSEAITGWEEGNVFTYDAKAGKLTKYEGDLDKVGIYYIKVSFPGGDKGFAPFTVVKEAEYEIIDNGFNYDESCADGTLKLYYDWADGKVEGQDGSKPYREDYWNTLEHRGASYADWHTAGNEEMGEDGFYVYPNCERNWFGALANPVDGPYLSGWPWVCLNFSDDESGQAYIPHFVYDNGDTNPDVTPWGDRVFGNVEGLKLWGVAQLAGEFNNPEWSIGLGDFQKDEENFGTDENPDYQTVWNYTEDNNYSYLETFDEDKFHVYLYPTEEIASPNELASAADDISDLYWTMQPTEAQYNGLPKNPTIRVFGYDIDGNTQRLSADNYVVKYFANIGTYEEGEGEEAVTVTSFSATDIETAEEVDEMFHAGEYFVQVGQMVQTEDGEAFEPFGDPKTFEITQYTIEVALQKLDLEYGSAVEDLKPEFQINPKSNDKTLEQLDGETGAGKYKYQAAGLGGVRADGGWSADALIPGEAPNLYNYALTSANTDYRVYVKEQLYDENGEKAGFAFYNNYEKVTLARQSAYVNSVKGNLEIIVDANNFKKIYGRDDPDYNNAVYQNDDADKPFYTTDEDKVGQKLFTAKNQAGKDVDVTLYRPDYRLDENGEYTDVDDDVDPATEAIGKHGLDIDLSKNQINDKSLDTYYNITIKYAGEENPSAYTNYAGESETGVYLDIIPYDITNREDGGNGGGNGGGEGGGTPDPDPDPETDLFEVIMPDLVYNAEYQYPDPTLVFHHEVLGDIELTKTETTTTTEIVGEGDDAQEVEVTKTEIVGYEDDGDELKVVEKTHKFTNFTKELYYSKWTAAWKPTNAEITAAADYADNRNVARNTETAAVEDGATIKVHAIEGGDNRFIGVRTTYFGIDPYELAVKVADNDEMEYAGDKTNFGIELNGENEIYNKEKAAEQTRILTDLGEAITEYAPNGDYGYTYEGGVGTVTVGVKPEAQTAVNVVLAASNYTLVFAEGESTITTIALGFTVEPQTRAYPVPTLAGEKYTYTKPTVDETVPGNITLTSGTMPTGMSVEDFFTKVVSTGNTMVGTQTGVLDGVKSDEAKKDIYTITVTKGDLTITPLDELHLGYEDLKQALYDHQGDLKAKLTGVDGFEDYSLTVYLPARKMTADNWYEWVLPFETTPRDFFYPIVEKDDEGNVTSYSDSRWEYGAINTLDLTKTMNGNVVFDVEMDAIAANTPFLVKIDKTIEGVNMETVNFTDVQIAEFDYLNKKPTAGTLEENGVQFVGFYEDKVGVASNEMYLAQANEHPAREFWKGGSNSATVKLVKTKAVLEFPSEAAAAGARIFIEEADGTYTAIKGVEGDVKAGANADGWYNVNGMKLNAAPTQKGIYIKDGKKVLVK